MTSLLLMMTAGGLQSSSTSEKELPMLESEFSGVDAAEISEVERQHSE